MKQKSQFFKTVVVFFLIVLIRYGYSLKTGLQPENHQKKIFVHSGRDEKIYQDVEKTYTINKRLGITLFPHKLLAIFQMQRHQKKKI